MLALQHRLGNSGTMPPVAEKPEQPSMLPEPDAGNIQSGQEAEKPDLKKGLGVIQAMLKTLPESPGVYRMLAADGSALYVGKARNLKNRVTSYSRASGLSHRLTRMVAETRRMEIVTTRTEVEALLLESNLIKTLKPRFNILLRDDKSFPYIMMTADHPFPQLAKHRGARKRKADWFGPFASASAVNRTITELARAFLLRTCPDTIFSSRSRPCLQYQIKRCTAPCVGKVTAQDYTRQVDQARRFLSGESQAIQREFATAMHQAADRLEFEEAARWRNRIHALTQIQARQDINLPDALTADIIALSNEAGRTCIQVFFMRNGANYGNRPYFPKHHPEETEAGILAAFIGQFYDDKPVPPELLTSVMPEQAALLAEALSAKQGRKISITRPQRGKRRGLLDMACRNAREALSRHLAETSSQQQRLEELCEVFGLQSLPQRIEIYDNSHIQGSDAVGAMVVAGPEGFVKQAYRKFNIIKDTAAPAFGGDDFAMMRQVLQRRFQRAIREDPQGKTGIWPDLVLIDGGKGQLSAALEVFAELGIMIAGPAAKKKTSQETDPQDNQGQHQAPPFSLTVCAISKGPDRNAGREQFHLPDRQSFTLPPNTPLLHYLQQLRDEAHRFAIGAHRQRRQQTATANPLDSIPGIGGKRKKALLAHFGSARAVGRADVPDLEAVDGISRQMAEKIYNWFH